MRSSLLTQERSFLLRFCEAFPRNFFSSGTCHPYKIFASRPLSSSSLQNSSHVVLCLYRNLLMMTKTGRSYLLPPAITRLDNFIQIKPLSSCPPFKLQIITILKVNYRIFDDLRSATAISTSPLRQPSNWAIGSDSSAGGVHHLPFSSQCL